jgi:8-oxo-dGTP pyrophosphatase MutT (NUDIX family)
MDSLQAKELLRTVEWQEDRVVPVVEGPYRYRVVTHCSSKGRQRAMFANGERSYFCYMELLGANGQWIQKGASMVPVLPDGRIIMVVEQRPAQSRYLNRPMVARITGQNVDLSAFGSYSSLEFPGGAVDPGEGLKAGFLRELREETGIADQTAIYYGRRHPIYQTGSDIALQQFLGVVYLSGLSYEKYVPSDGGLVGCCRRSLA